MKIAMRLLPILKPYLTNDFRPFFWGNELYFWAFIQPMIWFIQTGQLYVKPIKTKLLISQSRTLLIFYSVSKKDFLFMRQCF